MNQAEVKRKQIQLYSYMACVLILLYFGSIFGNSGMTCFAVALESLMFFLQVGCGNVADVFGRMLRYRRKRGQYSNVCTVRRRLVLLLSVLAVLCFGLMLGLADVLANNFFQIPTAGLIIKILSPILLIRMAISLFQGHFQSFGSHVQTTISYLLRPILYLLIGKALCNKTMVYGEKVSDLLRNEDFHGMYGAVGVSIALIISELIILAVMFLFYMISDRNSDKKKSKEGLQTKEPLAETLIMFGRLGGINIGIGLLAHLLVMVVVFLLEDKSPLGVYYGTFFAICALPILLIGARFYLLYAKMIYTIKGQNTRHVRELVQLGMKYTWCFGILACVLLAVLAPQITTTYFNRNEVVEKLLQQGSLLIPIVLIWVYLLMVNVAHGRYVYVVSSLVFNFVVYLLLGKFMQGRAETELTSAVTAAIIALAFGALVLGTITVHIYRLQIEYIYTFILPLACAGMIGLILTAGSKIITPHIGNEVCFYTCSILGILLYLFFLGVCRIFSEREINQLYGKVGRKCLSVFFK